MRLKNSIQIGAAMLAAATMMLAQQASQDQDGWHRLGGANQPPASDQNGPSYKNGPAYNDPPPPPPLPATLTIAPGTFFTIRVNQPLSSDHNQVGDFFTATLVKPIIVDGIVVTERGQTIAGRVSQVEKGGHGKGLSKLGIELTELTLVTGDQAPVRSQLISHTAPGSGGRDAAIVGTTTATGALIGGAVGWGTGAGIGAGIGAAAGLIGVFAAKGYPAVIHPESVLTFRVESPIVVATDRAPQAFRYAGPADYSQPSAPPRLVRRPAPPPPYYYGPGYYGPWGPYYGWGYPYYGPGFGIGFGYGRWR